MALWLGAEKVVIDYTLAMIIITKLVRKASTKVQSAIITAPEASRTLDSF